jgi:hypothetical protein
LILGNFFKITELVLILGGFEADFWLVWGRVYTWYWNGYKTRTHLVLHLGSFEGLVRAQDLSRVISYPPPIQQSNDQVSILDLTIDTRHGHFRYKRMWFFCTRVWGPMVLSEFGGKPRFTNPFGSIPAIVKLSPC